MPRGPRRDAPGCTHHVIVRGIDGCPIFLGCEDRLDFLRRLEHLLPEGCWRCYAWAFIPNHVHLVLRSASGSLSRLMARLNTGYARSFNLRHCRSGYLFQNRFKSRLVEDEVDLMGLVVYVNRNPFAAGVVASLEALESFPWCGYPALLGHRPPLAFESVEASLSLFGIEEAVARRRLRESMARPLPEAAAAAETRREGGCQRPMILAQAEQTASPPREARGHPRCVEVQAGRDASSVVADLVSAIADLLEVPVDDVRSPYQRGAPARARAAVAHLAVEQLGLSGKAVAAALRVSPSAVSHALLRGRTVVREERIGVISTQEASISQRS